MIKFCFDEEENALNRLTHQGFEDVDELPPINTVLFSRQNDNEDFSYFYYFKKNDLTTNVCDVFFK